ncbi:unnamed protein product [Calypogeia fissa]
MANAAAITVVRRLVSSAKSASPAKIGNRKFHSSGPKKMADHGHSDGSMYSNDYLHAPHMYNFTGMKNKRLKMGFMVFGSLAIGVNILYFWTWLQGSSPCWWT